MAKASIKNLQENIGTVLAEDIVFRGQLRFKDSLQINGNFEGKIETNGHLIVGESAHVRADIEAKNITVAGKLVGNIKQSDSVHLFTQSEVHGDIFTQNLTVESGSKFNGVCVMDT